MSDYKLVVNPSIVLREESDEWALLFEPDSGKTFVLNPVSVFIWKCLDGKHTIDDITEKLRAECKEVPDNADEAVKLFIEELMENELIF
ncbi:MAG TPA: SynChlorMet cassette protein ScmD [Thermodesulforhabdus norvegica]|uniref:SynChlorMet cassette protein ScmD n=1 Tax=Thermodesulforhabdus norvegica TaxID=39841 RepID=A0A7C1AXH7_9BACT|nr:MAG: SynChlorMet cassette protein ScmD [Gammaproteobacteria bacterium]HDL89468.1 SynChlorMet cassette protein ScmD [Thermodesulforhabdus norvegica]